jgi:hypothetical protein
MSVGRGRIRRLAAGLTLAAAIVAPAAAPAGAADVTLTASVGAEIGVLLGADGSVHDASTVPARVTRERRGDVIVFTFV